MVGQLADPLDDVVGRQQAVAPRARAVPRRRLRFACATRRAGRGSRAVLDRRLGDHRRQRLQDALRVADDRHLDGDVLADLGRVDVDVDDPGIRRVGPDVAGDPVVEAHPDRDQQVGALDRAVDVLPAVHAHVAVGERVRLVHRADAEQRPGDRDLRLLGERPQVVPGLGVEDAVAGEDDRPLGRRRSRSAASLSWRPWPSRFGRKPGQPGDDLGLGRVLRPSSPAGGRPW